MAVPAVNIVIEKNTSFSTSFKLKQDGAPLDLTGCTFTSKMKKHHTATTSYSFTVTPGLPASGLITVGMTTTTTATLTPGRYVYDVLMTLSGKTTKVIEGNAIVKGTAS